MEKLVRDKIIPRALSKWENIEFRQVQWDEKLEFLFKKLVEEALELQKDKNKEELADVEEVILALYIHLWWTKEEVEEARKIKLEKNGGFHEGYILTLPKSWK